ncbi:MAG TPA: trigger factor [Planctomycetota bacterium]|nr:trigger factor [Planctomycetota bacterium]
MAREIEEPHEHEELKLEPTVELEETGPCRIKVKIEIHADKIRTLVDRKYEKLNGTVQVPGFRRGHAPRNLLERRFGKELLEELKHDLVEKGFKEAAEDKKLEPISEPELLEAEKLQVRSEGPFAYAIQIETMPKVEIKGYSGLKVKKPSIPVEAKEIGEAVEELRDTHAEWEPVQKGEAQEKDQVVVDMDLLSGGKVVSTQENTPLTLAEGTHIHGVPLEGFHKSIVGKQPGESADYETEMPGEFEDKALAGKKVTIRVRIKGIKRKKLPDLDKDFFKIFDVDDEAELRDEVTKRLKKQKENEARLRMFADLLTQIMSSNEFPIPDGLIERAAEEQLRMSAVNLMQQGAPPEEIHRFLDGKRDKIHEDSRRSLREHLIIDGIAKAEKIFVTEEEVEQHIGRMAAEMGRSAEEVQAELDTAGLIAGLRRRLKTDKVMDLLLSKAAVEE